MNKPISQYAPDTARPLAGRVSLITGSTGGIGLGIARALAEAGSAIVLNGLGKPDDISATRTALAQEFGVKVRYSAADMSNPSSIAEMMAETFSTFGRLDILVNNAGIQFVAPLQDFPADKWDAILAINLSSAFHTTRLALPHMLENQWGRIINIASAHGLVASPFKSAYVAAKHGIVGLTKATALETAEHGHHLQRDLPWIRLHAAGRSPDRRSSEGPRHPSRAGDSRRAACAAAEQALRYRRGARRADALPRLPRGRLDHGCGSAGRRRLDGALKKHRRIENVRSRSCRGIGRRLMPST